MDTSVITSRVRELPPFTSRVWWWWWWWLSVWLRILELDHAQAELIFSESTARRGQRLLSPIPGTGPVGCPRAWELVSEASPRASPRASGNRASNLGRPQPCRRLRCSLTSRKPCPGGAEVGLQSVMCKASTSAVSLACGLTMSAVLPRAQVHPSTN